MYKQIIRPLLSLFKQDTSQAILVRVVHSLGKANITKNLIALTHKYEKSSLHREVFGIDFKNPIGLAAGFDTNAECISGLDAFGFSFIEIGSLTPKPQTGEFKGDVIRDRKKKAVVISRCMRNKGVIYAIDRLKNRPASPIIFGNIAPNTTSNTDDKQVNDYHTAFAYLYDFVDVLVVNVACPNENGMQMVIDKNTLVDILQPILETRLGYEQYKPILIKISPDTPFALLDEMIDYCRMSGIDGIVAGNSAKYQQGMLSKQSIDERCYVSGAPIFEKSLAMVKHINESTQGRFPIIGCGGIMTPEQAKQMLEAGASLIELYTGLIYNGPKLVKKSLKAISK